MTAPTLKLEIKINYPIFFGLTLLAHLLLVLIIQTPTATDQKISGISRTPLKIQSLGIRDSKSLNSVALMPEKPAPAPTRKVTPKKLNLSDLTDIPNPKIATASRPGKMPKQATALNGLRYGSEDFQKMANDPMLQGAANVLSSKRISLNFELPKGKNLDELNESELKLYSFLRRGAIKYVNSLSAEIKDFEMKNQHLNFPLTDAKQVLTGRMVFDQEGNLKQIKMVRWTNIDRLQGFFENVLKRLDTLQNPPKELWAQEGEFAIFVTLQVNG